MNDKFDHTPQMVIPKLENLIDWLTSKQIPRAEKTTAENNYDVLSKRTMIMGSPEMIAFNKSEEARFALVTLRNDLVEAKLWLEHAEKQAALGIKDPIYTLNMADMKKLNRWQE